MTTECQREQDVLDALSAQRWPDRCGDELRTHVAACAPCTDLVQVAASLLDERELAWRESHVPPSHVVWWRAQLRAREDAARAAARPLAFIQGVTATVAVWLVVVLLRSVPQASLAAWLTWARSVVPDVTFTLADATSVFHAAGVLPVVILCLLAAWLLLAPVAIYFAVADE
jgi:hypothetical protein